MKAFQLFVKLTAYYAAMAVIIFAALSIFPGLREYLPVGGVSVLVAVSAPHREETFEACRYVIEEIKKRAPVWKKEHYISGESEWLPGHSLVAEGGEETICCGKCGAHG